ncbi:MAG: restriction endonuclease [Anaerolineae bacterium]
MNFTNQQIQRYERIRVLEQMQKLDPVDFEHYCGWLYEKEGYSVEETLASGDEGVDLLLTKRGKKVVVQCKRYAGNVGQPVVRDLYGAMFHVAATEAHLCTTGRISRQAESWAAGKPIELIDGHDMVAWASKWRRLEGERRGAKIVWTTATALVAGIVAIAALTLLLGGWYFFSQRTVRPEPTPVLNIPILSTVTPNGGAPVEPEAEENTDGLPTAVATSEADEPTPEATEDAEETPAIVATATFVIENTAVPPTPQLPPERSNVNIPRRQNTIQIDGSLDDWDSVGQVAASTEIVYTADSWNGTDDLEANWFMAWDEQALYVAVFVIDDVHAQYSTGANTFRGDSLEIQFDTDRVGDFGTGISADEFQLEISPGDFGSIAPEAWRFSGRNNGAYVDAPGHQILVAAEKSDFGYLIEARIPWNAINVTPEAGLVLGANLNVNDNDTAGPLQEVMKSNVGTRSYSNPTSWGTLTLQ